jgi:hypothetical protein
MERRTDDGYHNGKNSTLQGLSLLSLLVLRSSKYPFLMKTSRRTLMNTYPSKTTACQYAPDHHACRLNEDGACEHISP